MYNIESKNKRFVWIKLYLLQTIKNLKRSIDGNNDEDQDEIYIIL